MVKGIHKVISISFGLVMETMLFMSLIIGDMVMFGVAEEMILSTSQILFKLALNITEALEMTTW